jgi:hypothetical protein
MAKGSWLVDGATTTPARGELVLIDPGSSWSAISGENPLLIIASTVDTVVSIEALDAFMKRRFES